jgi:hypothetical protein
VRRSGEQRMRLCGIVELAGTRKWASCRRKCHQSQWHGGSEATGQWSTGRAGRVAVRSRQNSSMTGWLPGWRVGGGRDHCPISLWLEGPRFKSPGFSCRPLARHRTSGSERQSGRWQLFGPVSEKCESSSLCSINRVCLAQRSASKPVQCFGLRRFLRVY